MAWFWGERLAWKRISLRARPGPGLSCCGLSRPSLYYKPRTQRKQRLRQGTGLTTPTRAPFLRVS